jgi:hypothetical protein
MAMGFRAGSVWAVALPQTTKGTITKSARLTAHLPAPPVGAGGAACGA